MEMIAAIPTIRRRTIFPDKAELQYAESFSIEYFDNYKVVTVHTPWPGAQEAVQYLLVQCGTPAPEGYDGVQRITVPIRRLAASIDDPITAP